MILKLIENYITSLDSIKKIFNDSNIQQKGLKSNLIRNIFWKNNTDRVLIINLLLQ